MCRRLSSRRTGERFRNFATPCSTSGSPASAISAYLEYAGEREYYLATAADKIYLVPTGSLDVTGIATYEVFLKGTLDKVGAQADFEKIGEYKTAPNQLTQTTFTPAHREMTESLSRDMYEQLVRGIAETRKKKVEDVRTLIDEGPFLARDAVRAGLVDGLAYEDQLDDQGAVSKSGTVEGQVYARVRRRTAPRTAPRIAVVYVSGIINSGDERLRSAERRGRRIRSASQGHPLGPRGQQRARDRRAHRQSWRLQCGVRCHLARADCYAGTRSPRGRSWHRCRTSPRQAGYYVAMAAPSIVAQPGTLTGSIGIFGGKFITGGVFEKVGANIESVIIGRNAGIESPERQFTDSERQKLREQIRDFYNGFIQKVAASRKMPVERVDQLAQGRVWTGAQARERGLVDALGGLDRAIALAKERAGIAADTEVEVVTYPARKTLAELVIEQLSGSGSDGQIDALLSLASGLRTAERRALGLLTAPARLFRPGEPLALMPVSFLQF